MEDKVVIQLTRPIKVSKDTCVVCGIKQWKCFNSIHSERSKNQGIPTFLQLLCHVNITRGGMCNPCEKALRKINRKIEQFRTSCHETLVKNRVLNNANLVRTGIQRKDDCTKKTISWPGKENLFVALSVCSNLPSALHHTVTTKDVHSLPHANSVNDDDSLCLKERSSIKNSQRICIESECFAKPALVSSTNQRTVLPLARLAAMKIGCMMGTGLMGSARMYRQASPKNREVKTSNEVINIGGSIHKTQTTNEDINRDSIQSNLRQTSIKEILQDADWLYRNDDLESNENTKQGHKISNTELQKNLKKAVRKLDSPTLNQQKRLKSNDKIIVTNNTKDIIYWESEWKKNNCSVYYTCSNCPEMLLEYERSIHNAMHRVNGEGFRCPQCEIQYDTWAAMREHLRCSHSMLKQCYKCDQRGCDKVFDSFKKLRQHMLFIHSFESALQTDKDARKMFDKKFLDGDAVVDELPPKDFCSICGIACKLEDVVDHQSKHSVSDCELVQCVACNLLLSNDQIKDHVLSMHRKLTYLYQCETCEFSSQTSAGLRRHMGIKHAKAILLVCDKCGKGFKTATALKVHHKRVHVSDDEKTVLCSTCGYLCSHETLLREHIRKVHKKPSWRRFKCPQCEHFSLRESSLERHIQMYHSQSEQRQFKCSYCQYSSKTKANLARHELTHKDCTPFLCPHCDFKGAKKQAIQEHILAKHTKEAQYNCTICGSAFSYHSNLTSHMEQHRASDGNQNTECIVADEQQDRLYFQL